MNRRGTNQHIYKFKYPFGLSGAACRSVLIMVLLMAIVGLTGHLRVLKHQSYIESIKRCCSPEPYIENGISIGPVYAAEPTPKEKPEGYENFSVREKVVYGLTEHFGFDHLDEIEDLVQGESSFNQYAINPDSGACGLFQAWPCVKLPCELSDLECQIEWGIDYINRRYQGSPTKAHNFWLSQNPHWY